MQRYQEADRASAHPKRDQGSYRLVFFFVGIFVGVLLDDGFVAADVFVVGSVGGGSAETAGAGVTTGDATGAGADADAAAGSLDAAALC